MKNVNHELVFRGRKTLENFGLFFLGEVIKIVSGLIHMTIGLAEYDS